MRESRWLLESAAVAAARDPLFIHQPDLTPRVAAVFRSHIARRSRGEPLAYVVGEASFRGLDVAVTADVLIPRPETEQLVDLVLAACPSDRACRVLDVGTGSGALAVALAVERPAWTVTATDRSVSALAIAERNAGRHGVRERIRFVEADLWPEGAWEWDLVVANLPYVGDDEALPADVAEWEPAGALRGGKTGTEVIERAVEKAERMSDGRTPAFFEIGEAQEPAFAARFPGRFEFRRDLAGRIRFMIGSV